MLESFRNLAQREASAAAGFTAYVVDSIGCTEDEARRVLGLYLAERLVVLGVNDGQWRVKHGALLDRPVLRRAVKLARTEVGR